MRNFLNKFGIPLVVVTFILAGVIYYFSTRTVPTDSQMFDMSKAFFIDEENNEEKTLPSTENPPLPGVSGKPTVVGVRKYSFDGGKTSKILYYWKYTDQYKKLLDEIPAGDAGMPQRAQLPPPEMLLRSPEPGKPWVSENSPEGQELKQFPVSPDGRSALILYPKH